MAAMRNHFDGSRHDPYTLRNPDEPFRPIALLRTGMGHGEGPRGGRPRTTGLPGCVAATLCRCCSEGSGISWIQGRR